MLAASSVCLLFPLSPSWGGDEEHEIRNRFFREAPIGWRAWQERMLHSKGVIKLQEQFFDFTVPNREPITRKAQAEFQSSGSANRRVVLHRSGDERVHVGARNPAYQFHLQRRGATSDYLIANLKQERGGSKQVAPWDQPDSHFHSYVVPLLHAPFSVVTEDLLDIVADPRFRPDSFRSRSDTTATEGFVEVHFAYDHGRKEYIPLDDVTVVLDPRNNWAVREYRVVTPDYIQAATINYSDEDPGKGHRYPTEYRETISDPPPKKDGMTLNLYTLDEIEFGDIPEREFTLSAFGLPEVVGTDASRAWPRTIWMLIIINIALVLCGLWWYFSKRARQAPR